MSTNPYQSPNPSPAERIRVRVPWRSIYSSDHFSSGAACGIVVIGGGVGALELTARLLNRRFIENWLQLDSGLRLLVGLVVLTGLAIAAIMLLGYLNWWRAIVPRLRELTWCVKHSPGTAEHWENRGLIYLYETWQYDLAVADFTRAIELEPHVWRHHQHRGEAQLGIENHQQAILDATQAIILLTEADELGPEHWATYAVRSMAYYSLKEYERTIADATEALRLAESAPDDRKVADLQRAVLRRETGDRASARRDFAAAHWLDWLWLCEPREYARNLPIMILVTAVGLPALYFYLIYVGYGAPF
jgi:tetratricopeptide (TPR) repeat protein